MPLSGLVASGDLWPPNWSQFLPDLVNAGATGALVAFIVWRLQLRHERKLARQRALDDWQRLKVWLKPHFRFDVALLPQNAPHTDPARDLRDALQGYPVEEWARLLPHHQDVVALAALESEWPQLVEVQGRVRDVIPASVKASRWVIPGGSAW